MTTTTSSWAPVVLALGNLFQGQRDPLRHLLGKFIVMPRVNQPATVAGWSAFRYLVVEKCRAPSAKYIEERQKAVGKQELWGPALAFGSGARTATPEMNTRHTPVLHQQKKVPPKSTDGCRLKMTGNIKMSSPHSSNQP